MTTVFTNGVFDILHEAHVRLLQFAASHGDNLIVGINSDISVRRLKGPTRPIMKENDRATILEALRCVDEVLIFSEDTPARLIKELHPDILVKGPEAANAEIPGADLVRSWGGLVLVPNWPVYESTSKIVERVLRR